MTCQTHSRGLRNMLQTGISSFQMALPSADLSLKLPFGVPCHKSSCPVTLVGILTLLPACLLEDSGTCHPISLKLSSLLQPHNHQSGLPLSYFQPDDCFHSHLYSSGLSPINRPDLCLQSPRTAQDSTSDHALFGWTLSGLHLSGHLPLPAFPMPLAFGLSHTNLLSHPRPCLEVSIMPFPMLFPCYGTLFRHFSSWKHSYSYREAQCQLTPCESPLITPLATDHPIPSSLLPE